MATRAPISGPIVVSPAQAGEMIGVSRQTIYNLMSRGALPSTKIGRSRRIRRSDLEALIERGADAA